MNEKRVAEGVQMLRDLADALECEGETARRLMAGAEAVLAQLDHFRDLGWDDAITRRLADGLRGPLRDLGSTTPETKGR